MKKHLFFSACLATALFSACSNNEVESVTESVTTLSVNLAINPTIERATTDASTHVTKFAVGDNIKIYSSGLTNEMHGVEYKIKDASGALEQTAENPTDYTYYGSTGASFYAFYPSSATSTDNAVTLTVPTIQDAVSYNTNDMMTARSTVAVAQESAVTLSFKHRLSLVKVSLSGFSNDTQVILNNILPTVTWTYSSDAVTTSGPACDITMWRRDVSTDQDNSAIEYWAVVPEQTINAGVTMFTIYANTKTYTFKPSSTIELKENTPIKFELTLDNSTKTVSLASSLDATWDTTTTGGVGNIDKIAAATLISNEAGNFANVTIPLQTATGLNKATTVGWTQVGSNSTITTEGEAISLTSSGSGSSWFNRALVYVTESKAELGRYKLSYTFKGNGQDLQVAVMKAQSASNLWFQIETGPVKYETATSEYQTVTRTIDLTKRYSAANSTTSADATPDDVAKGILVVFTPKTDTDTDTYYLKDITLVPIE